MPDDTKKLREEIEAILREEPELYAHTPGDALELLSNNLNTILAALRAVEALHEPDWLEQVISYADGSGPLLNVGDKAKSYFECIAGKIRAALASQPTPKGAGK